MIGGWAKSALLVFQAYQYIDSMDWDMILKTVSDVDGRQITGAEKRRLVIGQLDRIEGRVGTAVFNLCIELAVQWWRHNRK